MRTVVLLALISIGLLLGSAPAEATTIYLLTSDHCTGGCGTPPFGQVALTENGANLDVTVTLFNNNQFVKTGAADEQWFKFNAVGIVVGDITVDQNHAGKTLVATTGALNGDGTGNFAFGITCSNCGNGAGSGGVNLGAGPLIFHIANASIDDVDNPNNLGNVFVADILSGTTGNTGPVDATTPQTAVPEPGTLALVGSGLVSLGLGIRRRFRKG